ncbi:MAG: ABC transporter permease [Clostridia bacterium]|nr:ABC transporter permease [Clostridia bacterium]
MLNKKILRDIWKNKSQFITIFLMAFLAVFAFAGVHAYMDGMKESSEIYYNNQNLQDIWLTSKNFKTDKLDEIKKIDNVKNAERLLTINANVSEPERFVNPDTNKKLSDLVIECNFIETNEINKMYLIEGEEYSKEKSGLWLDFYLAKKLKIKVGDELELSIEGNSFKEKVKGLVEVPDHVYFIKDDTAIFPTHTDYGFCYLSINEFPNNVQPTFPYAIVDVNDTSKALETKNKIKETTNDIITATLREDNLSYDGYKREAEEGETYSGVFSGLFVFIAILSVVTTMNRFVKKERTQIGTLKALGIKRSKITKMYVNYGFFISVIASILGIILGNLLIGKFFLEMEMEYYEIPYYNITTIPLVYGVAIGIIIVITLVTYLSCRKILKEPAATALRIERPKVKVKENSFTTKKAFNKLSLSTKWSLRDIVRSKGRTLMAIVGIAGCTMLVVTAFGMLDSMKSYVSWEFETINNFEYKLSLSTDYTEKQYDDIISKYGNATSQTTGVEFKSNSEIIVKPLTINDTNRLLQVTDHNRNPFTMKDDGLYITEKMSKVNNLKIGDIVEWHIIGSDKWYKTKIVGLNRDPQAQQFNCTKNFFDTLEEEYKADSVYTNENLSGIKEIAGVNTIQTIKNLEDGMNSMLNMMYSLIALLIVVSVILAIVIIYNLGILSFSEKEYQFATLKVLGYKYKQIKKIFIKQNIWIGIFAIAIALPLGNCMTDYIFKNAIGDTYDFEAMIKPITFIISSIGTFVVVYIVNQFLARKIKKIDLVSSLKGNE